MVDRQRWHITKSQLEKCRRIFTYDPAVRNILDLKMVMESTVNCEFFQNISPFLHIELCKRATFQTVLILILNIVSHDCDMTVRHFAICDRIRVNGWLKFFFLSFCLCVFQLEPGKHLFKNLPRPPAFFVLVLRGTLNWHYYDELVGDMVIFIHTNTHTKEE